MRHFLSSIRHLLALDAASCLVMGAGLLLATAPLSDLTGLSPMILSTAGLLLLGAALIIAVVAARPMPLGIMTVIAGNLGWIAASIGVLALAPGNALGNAFIVIQACTVGLITWAEWSMWRRTIAAA